MGMRLPIRRAGDPDPDEGRIRIPIGGSHPPLGVDPKLWQEIQAQQRVVEREQEKLRELERKANMLRL